MPDTSPLGGCPWLIRSYRILSIFCIPDLQDTAEVGLEVGLSYRGNTQGFQLAMPKRTRRRQCCKRAQVSIPIEVSNSRSYQLLKPLHRQVCARSVLHLLPSEYPSRNIVRWGFEKPNVVEPYAGCIGRTCFAYSHHGENSLS